jgi:uncharacterized protein YciI
MEFLVVCEDIADREKAQQLRNSLLQEHLAYIESIITQVQVAGPLKAIDQETYGSSCFIYTTETAEEALRLLSADPYYQAGIYKSSTMNVFLPKAGNWVGGRNW